MNNEINIEKLREDLYDYFGTAMINTSPLAMMELTKIEKANIYELIKIAEENGFDLNKYLVNKHR